MVSAWWWWWLGGCFEIFDCLIGYSVERIDFIEHRSYGIRPSRHYSSTSAQNTTQPCTIPGKSSRCGQKWRRREESIRNNLRQYRLHDKFVDVFIADAAQLCSLWRGGAWVGRDDNKGGGNKGGCGGEGNKGGGVTGGVNEGVNDNNDTTDVVTGEGACGEDPFHNHLTFLSPPLSLFDAIITDR